MGQERGIGCCPPTARPAGISIRDIPVTATSSFAIDVPDSLLRRACGGDAAAFEQIYRWFERPVYTLGLRMLGDREEAMELLQDAMLKVFRRIGEFRGDSPFWGWLRQIAVNEALMRLRKRAPVDFVAEVPEPMQDDDAPLPATAADNAVLERALAQLPDTTRSVLWLYHAEGFTHEEIARQMGRTTSFSKSQLMRGLRRLRSLLEVDIEVATHV